MTFEQWIDRNLGKGIGGLFMHPYNFKVWGVKTSEVSRRIVDGEPAQTEADADPFCVLPPPDAM